MDIPAEWQRGRPSAEPAAISPPGLSYRKIPADSERLGRPMTSLPAAFGKSGEAKAVSIAARHAATYSARTAGDASVSVGAVNLTCGDHRDGPSVIRALTS